MTTDKLRNTNPVHIAFRSIDLYRAYLEHGLTETVASAAAIGELKTELDALESGGLKSGKSAPLNRETYEYPHGGFTASARGGRSTLPRWLVELEGDNGEEKR